MSNLVVKIKKLDENAVIPKYESLGAAAVDLVATSKCYDDLGNVVYGTGLAFEIPDGYAGFIYPRSSLSKYDLSLANSVGVVDSDYRGEVMLKFKPTIEFVTHSFAVNTKEGKIPHINEEYNIGDRIGQLIIKPIPRVEFEEVFDLSYTIRGSGGFGSTGSGGNGGGSPMGVMS